MSKNFDNIKMHGTNVKNNYLCITLPSRHAGGLAMTPKFIFTAVSHGAITLKLANIRSVKFTAVTVELTANM
jgi:hypothetical protein